MGESEVDEVDSGGPENDGGGLEIAMPPSQAVQRGQPVSDVDGGAKDALASGG
ncbi:MAG: hypothetical protein ACRDRX_17180 [Pseudonocardiaceae bacterium]